MYKLSFNLKNKNIKFNNDRLKKLYEEVLDWLYNNGYVFKGEIHSTFNRKILNINDVKELLSKYQMSHFYNISNSGKYILYNDISVDKILPNIFKMLANFGIDTKTIKIEGFDSTTKIKKFGEIDKEIDIEYEDTIQEPEKSKNYVKNPFGCKQEDGTETSTLCILGKSGSGKTTTTENALESMGHEVLLYIPIEGEYTFSQYTGSSFEMSSLGEFVMAAQNNPNRYYTVIIDECHRPITLSKLNTDLLQALSSRRNRNGQRFFTMDRSTKRMYVTPSEEFPIPLKEQIGKILVPDNFGIVCLSSNPSVISRNDDFLNRVDIAIFRKSDRDIEDLTELQKLTSKDTNTIRGILDSDGIN